MTSTTVPPPVVRQRGRDTTEHWKWQVTITLANGHETIVYRAYELGDTLLEVFHREVAAWARGAMVDPSVLESVSCRLVKS